MSQTENDKPEAEAQALTENTATPVEAPKNENVAGDETTTEESVAGGESSDETDAQKAAEEAE